MTPLGKAFLPPFHRLTWEDCNDALWQRLPAAIREKTLLDPGIPAPPHQVVAEGVDDRFCAVLQL